MSKEIRFNAFAMNCVGHMAPGLWRHPRDRSDRYIDLNHWTGLARSPASTRAIPELAPQWKKLDLAEILTRPAAFVSISQNKSLYETWGAQGSEKHRERGSLPATIKVVNAARAAQNFKSFSWIGYEVFRENYPQSAFDKVQYETWNAPGARRARSAYQVLEHTGLGTTAATTEHSSPPPANRGSNHSSECGLFQDG